MRRFALPISLIGISILLMILLFQKPIEITSNTDISKIPDNTKIIISGEVTNEILSKYERKIEIDDSLILTCNLPCPSFLNKSIQAEGYVERYNDIEKIILLKIKTK